MDQMCAGMEVGIGGEVKSVRLLWKQHAQEEC